LYSYPTPYSNKLLANYKLDCPPPLFSFLSVVFAEARVNPIHGRRDTQFHSTNKMGQLESKSESMQSIQGDEGLQNIRRRRNSNTTDQHTPTLSTTTTSSQIPSGLSIDFLTLLGKNIYHHSSVDQTGDYSRLSSDTSRSDESTTGVQVTNKPPINLAGKDVPRLVLIGTGGSGKLDFTWLTTIVHSRKDQPCQIAQIASLRLRNFPL